MILRQQFAGCIRSITPEQIGGKKAIFRFVGKG
jgi:hypothetical protein